MDRFFPDVVVSDSVPEGTVYLVPHAELVHRIYASGRVEEYLEWYAKQAAVITNIGGSK